MKKKGFTLAEVLIAVGIIGVMAALMATAFNHAKPDNTKMMYLKAYDSLNQAVQAMMSDSSVYHTMIPGTAYNVYDYPLLDLTTPENSDFINCSGNTKFGCVLAILFKTTTQNTPGSVSSFVSPIGNLQWQVMQSGSALPSPPMPGQINNGIVNQVTLTLDGRSFDFCVQPNGEIDALDSQGRKYLKNRRNVRSRNDQDVNTSEMCSARPYYINQTGPNSYAIAESSMSYNPQQGDPEDPPVSGCQDEDPCKAGACHDLQQCCKANPNSELCKTEEPNAEACNENPCSQKCNNAALCKAYKKCLDAGLVWQNGTCVTPSEGDDARKECEASGGYWTNGHCYSSKAVAECVQKGGQWIDGQCKFGKDDGLIDSGVKPKTKINKN